MSESAIDALVELALPLALYSGHPVVDKVLQTDLQYGKVSEIVGDSGVGKTQICYSVVANFLMKTTFSVVWLDSNGSFRASRLMRFLEKDEPSAKGEDSSLLLDRVHVARIADQVQLSSALQYIDDNFEAERIRLVVIDSVHEMFDDRLLNDYTGRTSTMNAVLSRITALTDIGCTVLTTNSVSSDEEDKSDYNKTWTHKMKGRLRVKDGVLQSLGAGNVPSRQCCFRIGENRLMADEYSWKVIR